jgi:hypothetical protein
MQSGAHSISWLVKFPFFLHAFLGISALFPGAAFIIAPDGHLIQMPLSNMANSPFPDFLIPGILLFVFIGIFPMAVAFSLWKRPSWRWPDTINPFKQFHWCWSGSLAAGLILIIWIVSEVQFMEIGFLHIFYFGWGILILWVTLLPGVRSYYGREI